MVRRVQFLTSLQQKKESTSSIREDFSQEDDGKA